MKWIGQHIWDFISRFRSTVYFENLETSSETNVLVVDGDGKVTKNSTAAGDITGVTAGDALTGGGTGGTVTINHEDTSSQASANNSGSTFIQDLTLDTYGHVTGLTSVLVPHENNDTTGTAASVTDPAQPEITTMTGFVTGSANEILTDDGDGTVSSESGLTFNGTTLASTAAIHTQTNSAVAASLIQNTGNNNLGGQLTLSGNRAGADAQDDDVLGTILFTGLDDGTPSAQSYGQIQTKVADATSGQEAGKMEFTVAEFDGSLTTVGLLLDGDTDANGEIDVTIGAGAASVTTIAGTLAIGSTTAEKVSSGQHIHKQVKITLSQANCNDLHSTPIELVPAQGTNTVIVPVSGIIMVDNNTVVNQVNSAADLNFHYADQEPGAYGTTSLFHIRRFMVGNDTTDIVYSLGELTGFEISQNLTDCVNKAVEVSVDSALTNDSMTSIKIFLSYHVIDIA